MATATLTWTDPTTRTDGSALTAAEIASIDIFDSAATNPAVPIGNVPGGAGTFTTAVLTVGDHAFTVIVNDTTGHKSAPSNAASVSVAAILAAPSSAANLAATLNP